MAQAETIEDLSVSELFSGATLNIPNIQRKYQWEQKQINNFMDDIYEHYIPIANLPYEQKLQKPFNLEQISVTYNRKFSRQTYYDINDGIQRITSEIILNLVAKAYMVICRFPKDKIEEIDKVIKDIFIYSYKPDASSEGKERLRLQYENPQYANPVEDLFFLLHKLKLSDIRQTTVQTRMEAVKSLVWDEIIVKSPNPQFPVYLAVSMMLDHLREKFIFSLQRTEEYKYENEYKEFVDFIKFINESRFSVYNVDKTRQYKMFITRNDRGLGLQPNDLLKTHIIKAIRDKYGSQREEEEGIKIWDETISLIYSTVNQEYNLSTTERSTENINSVIRKQKHIFYTIIESLGIIYYKFDDSQEWNRTVESVYGHITAQEDDPSFISSYIKPKLHKEPLEYLKFFQGFVEAYVNINKGIFFDRSESEELQEILIFSGHDSFIKMPKEFINLLMSTYNLSQKTQNAIYTNSTMLMLLRLVLSHNKHIRKQSILDNYNVDKIFKQGIIALGTLIKGKESEALKSIENDFKTYRTIYGDFLFKEETGKTEIRYYSESVNKEIARDSRNFIRFILRRVEMQISKDLKVYNKIPIEFITNPENCTIEHIAPQNFLDSPSWNYLKREDRAFTPALTHDIGNLCLLTRNDNAKNNGGLNLSFKQKIEVYKSSSYYTTRYITGNLTTLTSGPVSESIKMYPKYKEQWFSNDVEKNRNFYIRKFIESLGWLSIENIKYMDQDELQRQEYIQKMRKSWKSILDTGYIKKNQYASLSDYLKNLNVITQKVDKSKYTNDEYIKGSCALECANILYTKILNSPIKDKIKQVESTFNYRFNRNFPRQEEWNESQDYQKLRGRAIRQFTYMTPIFDLDEKPQNKMFS